jgi:hypothetical protein
MRKIFSILLCIPGFISAPAQQTINGGAKNTLPRPKLVVGIVVDQMRWDFLYKYYDRLGEEASKDYCGKVFPAKMR